MKITIKSSKRRPFSFYLPLFFLKSRLLFKIISKGKADFPFQRTDISRLINEFKQNKAYFPKLELVRIEAADGAKIILRL